MNKHGWDVVLYTHIDLRATNSLATSRESLSRRLSKHFYSLCWQDHDGSQQQCGSPLCSGIISEPVVPPGNVKHRCQDTYVCMHAHTSERLIAVLCHCDGVPQEVFVLALSFRKCSLSRERDGSRDLWQRLLMWQQIRKQKKKHLQNLTHSDFCQSGPAF